MLSIFAGLGFAGIGGNGGPPSGHCGFKHSAWWPVVVGVFLDVPQQLAMRCRCAGKPLELPVRFQVSPELIRSEFRLGKRVPLTRTRGLFIRVGMGGGVRIYFIGGAGKGGGLDCLGTVRGQSLDSTRQLAFFPLTGGVLGSLLGSNGITRGDLRVLGFESLDGNQDRLKGGPGIRQCLHEL